MSDEDWTFGPAGLDDTRRPAWRRERHAIVGRRGFNLRVRTKDGEWAERTARELETLIDRRVARAQPEDFQTDAVFTIHQRLDDDWEVEWVVAEQGSSLVVRAIRVEAISGSTPSGGATANLLRKLSPAEVLTRAADHRTDLPDDPDRGWEQILYYEATERASMISPDQPKRGRPKMDDQHLAKVAVTYLDELQRGRGVLGRMATRLADRSTHPLPTQTVRDWVRAARRDGFLTPARKQGSRGAEPGPRLLDIINQQKGN